MRVRRRSRDESIEQVRITAVNFPHSHRSALVPNGTRDRDRVNVPAAPLEKSKDATRSFGPVRTDPARKKKPLHESKPHAAPRAQRRTATATAGDRGGGGGEAPVCASDAAEPHARMPNVWYKPRKKPRGKSRESRLGSEWADVSSRTRRFPRAHAAGSESARGIA